MKVCTKCHIAKPVGEFYSHHQTKDGLRPLCKRCKIEHTANWQRANPDKVRAYAKRWRRANGKIAVQRSERWRKANPERAAGYSARWRKANPELSARGAAARTARWVKANPGRAAELKMRRNAQKLCATPAWANEFFIAEIYHLAQLRTKLTGIKWHVDHIVPLRSKRVCGLHVEHNLQVLPAAKNESKSNRYWPDMPEVAHG